MAVLNYASGVSTHVPRLVGNLAKEHRLWRDGGATLSSVVLVVEAHTHDLDGAAIGVSRLERSFQYCRTSKEQVPINKSSHEKKRANKGTQILMVQRK